jgi:DNA-binding transcriptional MocR family regulator
MNIKARFGEALFAGQALEVKSLMTLISSAQKPIPPGMIDLGIGQPSPRLLPAEAMAKAAAECARQPERLLLSYGPEQGDAAFRDALAGFLSESYRLPVDPDHLIVTNGASQALDLICSLFTQAGDVIFVEEPTYFLALKIFADHRLRVVPLPMDAAGLSIDALEEALGKEKPALLYTIPTYHNPASTCLAEGRRERLATLCRENGVLLVADEVYHLLSYTAAPPLPLARFCGLGGVISLGSFSKILAPGLRLGWLQAAPELIARFLNCGLLDSGGGLNPFAAGIVRSAIELGLLSGHLAELKAAYAPRMQAMCAALREHLPGDIEFLTPEGGFFVWLSLPEAIEARVLLQAAKTRNVEFMPGPRFSSRGGLTHHLRLSFAFYDEPDLLQGIERLAAAISAL